MFEAQPQSPEAEKETEAIVEIRELLVEIQIQRKMVNEEFEEIKGFEAIKGLEELQKKLQKLEELQKTFQELQKWNKKLKKLVQENREAAKFLLSCLEHQNAFFSEHLRKTLIATLFPS